jgi:ankyrin repeat protein
MRDFFAAIKTGHLDEVRRLLRGTPDLIHAKEDGLSPVLVAAYHNQPDIADFLAEKTVALTVFEAAATGRRPQIARILAREPGLINAYSEDGYQPLGLACFFGHLDVAKYLLGAGARLNSASKNKMKVTPLHSAAARGHAGIVKLLLQHGADPDALQERDFTALHAAAQNGDVESIQALLFHGADAHAKTSEGKTPLDYASEAGKAEAVKILKQGITKKLKKRK